MNTFDVILAVIAGMSSILSIVIAILAFGRNKTKDTAETEAKLARIETDIAYIRRAVEREEQRYDSLEKRVRILEGGRK